MAWRVAEFLRGHPDHVLFIVVGDFHASYFGGLPDRLRARGVDDILVISQVNAEDSSEDERRELIEPHPVYGPRADFVWSTEPK